jgi:hypothetical protein
MNFPVFTATLIFVMSLMVVQSMSASDAIPDGSWMNPVYVDNDSQSSTRKAVVRYSFDSNNIALRAREITVKVSRRFGRF